MKIGLFFSITLYIIILVKIYAKKNIKRHLDNNATGSNSTASNATGSNSTASNATGSNSTASNSTGSNSTASNTTGSNTTGSNTTSSSTAPPASTSAPASSSAPDSSSAPASPSSSSPPAKSTNSTPGISSNVTIPSSLLPDKNNNTTPNKTTPSSNTTDSGTNPSVDRSNNTIINKTTILPFNDVLLVSLYNSTLNSTQRDEYMYWVKYKNSFSTNQAQLAKMTKYFTPEIPTYYQTLYKSAWPFYSLGGFFTLLLILYIILRFGCGRFTGPKQHITRWYGITTYGLIFVGFTTVVALFIIALLNSAKIK